MVEEGGFSQRVVGIWGVGRGGFCCRAIPYQGESLEKEVPSVFWRCAAFPWAKREKCVSVVKSLLDDGSKHKCVLRRWG
jgi:hypothetical protein